MCTQSVFIVANAGAPSVGATSRTSRVAILVSASRRFSIHIWGAIATSIGDTAGNTKASATMPTGSAHAHFNSFEDTKVASSEALNSHQLSVGSSGLLFSVGFVAAGWLFEVALCFGASLEKFGLGDEIAS